MIGGRLGQAERARVVKVGSGCHRHTVYRALCRLSSSSFLTVRFVADLVLFVAKRCTGLDPNKSTSWWHRLPRVQVLSEFPGADVQLRLIHCPAAFITLPAALIPFSVSMVGGRLSCGASERHLFVEFVATKQRELAHLRTRCHL